MSNCEKHQGCDYGCGGCNYEAGIEFAATNPEARRHSLLNQAFNTGVWYAALKIKKMFEEAAFQGDPEFDAFVMDAIAMIEEEERKLNEPR